MPDYAPDGALFEMNGVVATNATWDEDIYFTEAGLPFVLTDLRFKMTFRRYGCDQNASITLSTDAGTLVISDDDDGYARILRLNVTAGALNGYCGDYVTDLASEDNNGKVTLWAHGVVTFRQNPVSF